MPSTADDLQLSTDRVAAGGDAVARDIDGRVVFVEGALPGERVRARVIQQRRYFARAVTVDVIDAAPERIAPPCPHVADGCGGCGWQHVEPAYQRTLKATIVADTLRRVGRVQPPKVEAGPDLPVHGFRTIVRAGVVDGRAGLRHRRSTDIVAVDACLVAHPLVEEVLVEGRFGAATEVVVRAGAATGERLVIVRPTAEGVTVPDGVAVVGADELAAGRRAWIHEEVAGRRWRVSATSFFQSRPDGAAALVDAVRSAASGAVEPGARVIDLYAGVGLFAGTVAEGRRPVLAVESSPAGAADARHNLADLDARVVQVDVQRWTPSPAALVVADPPRTGLGRRAVRLVAGTRADRVVLVSCDPAALARDAGLLSEEGYRLVAVTLVDLFPQTPRLEVVSRFDRVHPSPSPAS